MCVVVRVRESLCVRLSSMRERERACKYRDCTTPSLSWTSRGRRAASANLLARGRVVMPVRSLGLGCGVRVSS